MRGGAAPVFTPGKTYRFTNPNYYGANIGETFLATYLGEEGDYYLFTKSDETSFRILKALVADGSWTVTQIANNEAPLPSAPIENEAQAGGRRRRRRTKRRFAASRRATKRRV